MKTLTTLGLSVLFLAGLIMLAPSGIQAQECTGGGSNFVDLDGDGFNDNAPDHDGDGIPNGLDPDYIKGAKDGDGYKKGNAMQKGGQGTTATKTMTKAQAFARLQAYSGFMFQNRVVASGSNPGMGNGVCDGSGSGSGGVCDGTGPHGSQNKGGGGNGGGNGNGGGK